MNLRTLAEADLETTLENTDEVGVRVDLINPEGERITTTVDGRPLAGQVTWAQPSIDPETGAQVAIYAPAVTLRRSSLASVPKTGEKWIVVIPSGPAEALDPTVEYLIDPSYAVEGGKSLGKVRIPLVVVKQAVSA
jgi:hypothetical protein